MGFEQKLAEASIVVVGDFNPRIFQPEWFHRYELLRPSEVEAAVTAENFVLTEQLTNFEADWLLLQVTRDRFFAKAKDPSKFRVLGDFVAAICELLEHTPVRLLGLNRMAHYQVDSVEEWHKIGDTLVPKEIWDGILEETGLRGVNLDARARNELAEHFHLKIQPSARVQPHGVYFDFNEQYNVALLEDEVDQASSPASYFAELIGSEWEGAGKHSAMVADALLERILGESK